MSFAVASIICACVGGAVLAEWIRPAPKWRDSLANIACGCFAGTYGPQAIEIWIERLERSHTAVVAVCSLSGAIIIRAFLAWLSRKKFEEIVATMQRVSDALRRRPEPSPPGSST